LSAKNNITLGKFMSNCQ